MIELRCQTSGERETETFGEQLASVLRAGDVLTLDGALGAGKTRLVRGMARGLGVDERLVASPTYVIVHEYPVPSPMDPPLVHMDAYRLSGGEELESLGWDRINDGSSIVVIEWGERVVEALGETGRIARLFIRAVDDQTRELRLIAPPEWKDRAGGNAWKRLEASAGQMAGAAAEDERGVCPTCGKRGEHSAKHTERGAWPFCSERCRNADLYKWFAGTYTLSRAAEEEDFDDAGAD